MKKRKDGRYEHKMNLGYDPITGKYKRVTIYGKTQNEVKAKMKEYFEKPIRAKKKVTFIEYATNYLELKKPFVAPRTLEMYEQKIYNNLKGLHYLDLKEITRDDVQAIINMNIEHPRTCQQLKQICVSIFDNAVDDGLMPKNVAKFVKCPKYQANKKRALTDAENVLTDIVELNDKEKAYILIIKWTGLRKEEALALQVDDIDFDANTISVNKALSWINNKPIVKEPKSTSGYRSIPMIDELHNYLQYYVSNLSSTLLFTNRDGSMITQQGYKRMWESILKKINALADSLGYERPIGLTSHIFRHNYASMLFNIGVSPKEAQVLLGHSNFNITMDIYTHIEVDNNSVVDGLKNFKLSSNCRQNQIQA